MYKLLVFVSIYIAHDSIQVLAMETIIQSQYLEKHYQSTSTTKCITSSEIQTMKTLQISYEFLFNNSSSLKLLSYDSKYSVKQINLIAEREKSKFVEVCSEYWSFS